jgi:hypothetical protein
VVTRREQWQKVLDTELRRWSALSVDELVSRLGDIQSYVVTAESKTYQVEVEILENAAAYLHVMVAVDDGSLPASLWPVTASFIREKPPDGPGGDA